MFQSALEKPAGDREVFLRRACLGDTALFDEVLTLLQAHEEAGSFLGEPLVEIPRRFTDFESEGIARQLTAGRVYFPLSRSPAR